MSSFGSARRPLRRPPTAFSGIAVAGIVLLLLLPATAAGAPLASADTLTLPRAIALAREANPVLRAARLRVEAAHERRRPAGAWPEPELTLSLMNRSLTGGTMADPMGMTTIRVTQMVPWSGAPGRLARSGASAAEAEEWDLAERDAQVTAAVTEVFARLARIEAETGVLRETLELLQGLRAVALAHYAAGEAPQQDVLQAQIAAARMEGEVLMLDAERAGMMARLGGLLGRDVHSSVVVVAGSGPMDELPGLEELVALARAGRPALAAAAARVAAAGHAAEATRRERWPDLMVGAEYARRADFDDMASLMIGARLPILAASRQRPMEREQAAMAAMAAAELNGLEVETRAMLAEQRAMAERARRLAGLYDAEILPQAEAALSAARSAYQVSTAEFATLLESQMTLNRYRVERLRLVAEYFAARAAIAALLGSEENGR
jgi:outer membrane protein TolC